MQKLKHEIFEQISLIYNKFKHTRSLFLLNGNTSLKCTMWVHRTALQHALQKLRYTLSERILEKLRCTLSERVLERLLTLLHYMLSSALAQKIIKGARDFETIEKINNLERNV